MWSIYTYTHTHSHADSLVGDLSAEVPQSERRQGWREGGCDFRTQHNQCYSSRAGGGPRRGQLLTMYTQTPDGAHGEGRKQNSGFWRRSDWKTAGEETPFAKCVLIISVGAYYCASVSAYVESCRKGIFKS